MTTSGLEPIRLSVSSLADRYPGIVAPAHFHAPAFVATMGPIVADLCARVDFGPDPEQAMMLDVGFGRRIDGLSAAFEIDDICCRQNMKTGLFKQFGIGWLFVTDERLIVWSAHEFATSSESFRDLVELIEGPNAGILRKRLKANGIHTAHGSEAIELKTGARMVFKTRTKGSGRGLSGRKVILDEGFALKAAHMGALLPLLSAQPDPQVLVGSSACLEDSEVLRGVVDRGRAGLDPRQLFAEWCAPDPERACARGQACDHRPTTPGCGCDNEDYWQASNPALDRRIARESIRSERLAMASIPEEFGRERMGWHDAPVGGLRVIDAVRWALCEDSSPMRDPVVLALDVQPAGKSAAITAAGRIFSGHVAVEVVDDEPGTDWLVTRLRQIPTRQTVNALVLDPTGPAGAFLADLLADGSPFVKVPEDEPTPRGKVRLVLVSGTEYAQACGAFEKDVREDALKHYGQRPLDEAVEGARAKDAGDGAWRWSRRDSTVNIAPLVAATLARHGFARFGTAKTAAVPFAMSF